MLGGQSARHLCLYLSCIGAWKSAELQGREAGSQALNIFVRRVTLDLGPVIHGGTINP